MFVGESLLTPKMLESLKSFRMVSSGQIRLREAAASRSGKSVTIGSYYRTVKQGRKNIRASLVTLMIALWEGLIKPEEVRRLFDLAGKPLGELSESDLQRVGEALDALLEKIIL